MTTHPLLTPFNLHDLSLKNRVVMAPLTRSRAGESRIANGLMAEYYAQRASAGLIISEATVVSEQGIGWPNSPGIYTEEQIEGWKKVTSRLKETNTPIFLQLWHCGRSSHTDFHPSTGLPVSASAIKLEGKSVQTPLGEKEYETPRALTSEEVAAVVNDYKNGAAAAKEAGFDGVEIHSANGYLLDQFLQSKTNKREDKYGGSTENRFQFLREVVEAIQTVLPANRIGVRLSPNGIFNDMGSPDYREQFLYAARELNSLNIGYLHVMDGLAFGFHKLGEPMTLTDFRQVFTGPIIGNCGYTLELADERIEVGDADLIAFGRPYISNPDLVERFQHNTPLAEDAPQSVWYDCALGGEGYTSYPPAA